MLLTMIAIRLADALITSHPSDGVFYEQPKTGESGVIDDILSGTVFTAWFAARTEAQTCCDPNFPDTKTEIVSEHQPEQVAG